jgi:hypothetical protein
MSANNGSWATDGGAATATRVWGGAPGLAKANIRKAATATSQDIGESFRETGFLAGLYATADVVNEGFTGDIARWRFLAPKGVIG